MAGAHVPYTRVYLHLLKFDEERDTCHFNDKVVHKIEFIGSVVERNLRENFHTFTIDDGTNNVHCIQFPPKNDPLPHDVVSRTSPEIQKIYEDSLKEISYIPNLGDCLHIRGRTSFHRGKPQVIIDRFCVVENSNDWWFQAFDLEAYRKVETTEFIT